MVWAASSAKRDTAKSPNGLLSFPMADNEYIYKGDIVRVAADGYATSDAAAATGDMFVGVAVETVDNTGTGHAAGAKNITVDAEFGSVHSFAFDSASQSDVGTLVYNSVAADPQTVIGSDGTHAVLIGACVEYVSTTEVRVAIHPGLDVAT